MRAKRSTIIIALCAFVFVIALAGAGGSFQSPTMQEAPVAHIDPNRALPELPAATPEVKSEPEEPDPQWERPKSPVHIAHVLEVGEYHGEEVKARTGERWLGLYVTNKGASLSETILKVTKVKDEMVDDEKSNARTGRRVSVNRRPAPVLLVKGVRTLRPGPVGTSFLGETALGSGANIQLTLGAATYNLYVKTIDRDYGSSINRNDAKLILRKDQDENNEQVLYDLGGKGDALEAYWNLLWAGDMDGDNKLDLYVQVSYHYNVTQRKLFLSSQAEKGGLVREVAEFKTVGC